MTPLALEILNAGDEFEIDELLDKLELVLNAGDDFDMELALTAFVLPKGKTFGRLLLPKGCT